MSYWTRVETELLITISAGNPHRAWAETTWPFYVTRLERSEGFELTQDHRPTEGGRFIGGNLDLGAYNWIWLRRQATEQQQERFEVEKAKLTSTREQVDYSPDAGERQTLFLAQRDEPYWMTIETDAAIWLQRLGAHPYAVCVLEQTSGRDDAWVGRQFRFPRHLLTVRASKPTRELTDEQRGELRERLARARRG